MACVQAVSMAGAVAARGVAARKSVPTARFLGAPLVVARPARVAAPRAARAPVVAQASTEELAKVMTVSAVAGNLFFADSAAAAQEFAQLADGRFATLLGLGLPVLAFVAFNIAAPGFRQLENMAETASTPAKGGKRRAVVAGLTGLSAAALASALESADAAEELAQMADGRVGTLLGLALPVVAFVAFNIGLPAFRQLQQMADKAVEPAPKKGGKRRAVVAGLTGLSAAALAAAPESADAAQELAQMADGRVGTLLGLALPVVAFVAFNIGLPAFRQLQQMADKATEPAPKKGGKKR